MNLKILPIFSLFIQLSIQTLPGNTKTQLTKTVVAPVQFPGILNPDVYVENTQSNPQMPHIKNPPITFNLHVDDLNKYYKPDPIFIKNEVHNHMNQGLDAMASKMKQKFGNKLNKITLNIQPQRFDNPEDFLDPSNKFYLGQVLNHTKDIIVKQEQEQLIQNIQSEMKSLESEFQNMNQLSEQIFNQIQRVKSKVTRSILKNPEIELQKNYI